MTKSFWGICILATSCLGLAGCTTMSQLGFGSLKVNETQQSFTHFIAMGQQNGALNAELKFVDQNGQVLPPGLIQKCENDNSWSLVNILDTLRLKYTAKNMSGGGFTCATESGARDCGNMTATKIFRLCLGKRWQEDLNSNGQSFEIIPKELTLEWKCKQKCGLYKDGELILDTIAVKSIRHENKDQLAFMNAGMNMSLLEQWKAAGFTVSEAILWGPDIQPQEAVMWKSHGWSIALAKEWKKFCPSLLVATEWQESGFNPTSYDKWKSIPLASAKMWQKAGYTFEQSTKFTELGIQSPAQARNLQRYCPQEIKNLRELYSANPYDLSNHCYQFTGTTLQILGRNGGLMKLSSRVFYLNFGKKAIPPHFFRGIVRGAGTRSYTSVSGSQEIVGSLKVISIAEEQ